MVSEGDHRGPNVIDKAFRSRKTCLHTSPWAARKIRKQHAKTDITRPTCESAMIRIRFKLPLPWKDHERLEWNKTTKTLIGAFVSVPSKFEAIPIKWLAKIKGSHGWLNFEHLQPINYKHEDSHGSMLARNTWPMGPVQIGELPFTIQCHNIWTWP